MSYEIKANQETLRRSSDALLSKIACRIVGGALQASRRAFPRVVRIETTNACNARCTICPHSASSRPITRMDETLFVRLIDECASSGCREIHLHNFGEPLMDKRLEQRINYAKNRGIKKVKIFSNGSLLDRARAKRLLDAGLDEIKISIDGASKEEFERIRVPLKFETVIENTVELVALRNVARSPLKVLVTCCSTSDKQASMQPLKNVVDGFFFCKIHNWGGIEQTNGRKRIRKPCSRLWRNLTVLASGDVSLCCLDYDGQYLLGRLDENTTIREIWNNHAYRQARLWHKQGRQDQIPLCANCSKSFLY
jgi:radical SAM protein with 4Fe4S-binding SPASM domain